MFKFMMKVFDAIDFEESMQRTAYKYRNSPDLHERLVAEIRAYEKRRDERRAGLKAYKSAPAEGKEGLAAPNLEVPSP